MNEPRNQMERIEWLLIRLCAAQGLDVEREIEDMKFAEAQRLLNKMPPRRVTIQNRHTVNAIGGPPTNPPRGLL